MSDLVDPSAIEELVGAPRHQTEHWGRAVSADQTVYILHSETCRESTPDLRECPFSVALDRGIQHFLPWTGWRRCQDRAVRIEIYRGYLLPHFATYKAAMREATRS